MPIVYQYKKKDPMNNALNVTPVELETMRAHHRKYEYTSAEMMEVYNLVRKYINPHQNACTSCSNALREAKDLLNKFFLDNLEAIEARHAQEELESTPIEEEVSEEAPKKKKTLKKKRGRPSKR